MSNTSVKLFFEFGPMIQQMCLKIFLIYSSGPMSAFFQRSGTICEFLVEGIMRYILVKLFGLWTSCSGRDVV